MLDISDLTGLEPPTLVNLERTYLFHEPEEENTTDWALPLWLFIRKNIEFTCDIASLRSTELSNLLHERFVNYVFSLLIVTTNHSIQKSTSESLCEDDKKDHLRQSIDSVLDIEPTIRDTLIYYLEKIDERIRTRKAYPSKGQINKITQKATKDGHRCYLCGRVLHYDRRPYGNNETPNIEKIREKLKFEIEHIWSKSRGGSRTQTNLAASCNECNKIKSHLISPADIAIEQIMTTATTSESVKKAMSGEFRLAVLWQQKGKCAMCTTNFHDIDPETIYLTKKEKDQPFHFFNMMASCANCNAQYNLEGVELRA